MKYLLTIFTFLLLFTQVQGQELTDQPHKKSNAIWILTDDDSETAYKKIARLIMDNGFQIGSSDATLQTISTKPAKKGTFFEDYLVELNASVRNLEGTGTAIKLQAKYSLESYEWLAEGANRKLIDVTPKPRKKLWEEIHSIAESYDGAKLKYSRD